MSDKKMGMVLGTFVLAILFSSAATCSMYEACVDGKFGDDPRPASECTKGWP